MKSTRKRRRGPHSKRRLWTLPHTDEIQENPGMRACACMEAGRQKVSLRRTVRSKQGRSWVVNISPGPWDQLFLSLKRRQKGINLSWHLPLRFLKKPRAQHGRTDLYDVCLCKSSELLAPALHKSGGFLIAILYLATSVLLADCKSIFVAHPPSTQIFQPVNQPVQPWLNCLTSHHTSIKLVRVQNAGNCGHQGTHEPWRELWLVTRQFLGD